MWVYVVLWTFVLICFYEFAVAHEDHRFVIFQNVLSNKFAIRQQTFWSVKLKNNGHNGENTDLGALFFPSITWFKRREA